MANYIKIDVYLHAIDFHNISVKASLITVPKARKSLTRPWPFVLTFPVYKY